MKHIRPHTAGLAFGTFLAIWHLLWSSLVALGVAQAVVDFIFRLHMIAPAYTITEFHLSTAAGLVSLTAVIGYAAGWAVSVIWNRVASGNTGV